MIQSYCDCNLSRNRVNVWSELDLINKAFRISIMLQPRKLRLGAPTLAPSLRSAVRYGGLVGNFAQVTVPESAEPFKVSDVLDMIQRSSPEQQFGKIYLALSELSLDPQHLNVRIKSEDETPSTNQDRYSKLNLFYQKKKPGTNFSIIAIPVLRPSSDMFFHLVSYSNISCAAFHFSSTYASS